MGQTEMVESLVKAKHDFETMSSLQQALPQHVEIDKLRQIVTSLESQNKIALDALGAIFWIESNEKLDKLHDESVLLRD